MSDKKKGKKRKEGECEPDGGAGAAARREHVAVARWLRAQLPPKRTKLHAHPVVYFTGRRAVDALLESPWAAPASPHSAHSPHTPHLAHKDKDRQRPLFVTRLDASLYLNTMLMHKFFHRAKKVPVSESELRGRKRAGAGGAGEAEGEGGRSGAVRKRKVRLEMAAAQVFEDGGDAYVWVWEETPRLYWLAGLGVVCGGVALCLFPLWPWEARRAVYWVSVGAAALLAGVLLLAALRLLLFTALWLGSLGRHHLWLLPNLTEDCGFLASFRPLYTYSYRGPPAPPAPAAPPATARPALGGDTTHEPHQPDRSDGPDGPDHTDRHGHQPDEPECAGGGEGSQAGEESSRSSTDRDYEMVELPRA